MTKILAACGNDCSACPRYTAPPFEKTDAELQHIAELWQKIGYRDHVATKQEISCQGCTPDNWCRYEIAKCCQAKNLKTCAPCAKFPCGKLKTCFEITKSFEPNCRKACTAKEYEQLSKAFFEKEKNLNNP